MGCPSLVTAAINPCEDEAEELILAFLHLFDLGRSMPIATAIEILASTSSSWLAIEKPPALLRRAGLLLFQPTKGIRAAVPTVEIPSESVARRRRLVRSLSRDAVSVIAESPEALRTDVFRTPRLQARGASEPLDES